MTTLTPEQRQAVARAGDDPVVIEDPDTHAAYVLLKAEVFDRVQPFWNHSAPTGSPPSEVPEGIRRSQEAFFRALPDLLKEETLRRKWVAYHGDEQVKIGRTQTEVIQECNRRGLKRDEYDVFVIEPQSPEPEEVTFPSSWL